ncbi:hypothetical protein [Massilia sp. S19_KUP03_FR1]|uniref:hypothetical protein n=1 Tax=Massilia sp. S19_KUP03_FR1 TaxID=3025503 RepID=UPI002FCD7A42
MTRDRRGFEYALDGVRRLTGWKVDELTLDLARSQGEVALQQGRVDALDRELRAASTRLMGQRQVDAILDIGAERSAHVYLIRVQQALGSESAQLRILQEQMETVRAALLESRRFADSLDRDRDSALAEHDLTVARLYFAAADDSWMQRQHGRKTA